MKRSLSVILASCICLGIFLPCEAKSQTKIPLDSILINAKEKYNLPAMGVALVTEGKLQQIVVNGIRKFGDTTKVQIGDNWHLGSCSKAFTATLIAVLVEAKKLDWKTTIGEVFPDMKMDTAFKRVTVEMLLCHFGGLPTETWPPKMTFQTVWIMPGSPKEVRLEYVKRMLAVPPKVAPGTKYQYSNAGITVAAVMAERIMNKSYEEMMTQYIFTPLGIKTGGFGAMNTQGKVDQPWQHAIVENKITPIDAGVGSDNPPAITPAGRIHMSLADWAKFATAHVLESPILKPETWQKIHSLPFGGGYGFGWGISQRDWAGGITLSHDGSNNWNYCSIWLAPKRKFAIMVTTNEGGDKAAQACTDVVAKVVTALYIH